MERVDFVGLPFARVATRRAYLCCMHACMYSAHLSLSVRTRVLYVCALGGQLCSAAAALGGISLALVSREEA